MDIQTPDGLFGFIINWDNVVYDFVHPSSIPVDDKLVNAFTVEIPRYEECSIMFFGKKFDFVHANWKAEFIKVVLDLQVFFHEEIGPIILRVTHIQIV